MIRRELTFANGQPQWLLISQVEHARLSGELARRCIDRFGPSGEAMSSVRQELLDAITHHDDGWLEWEHDPRLDPEHGRPLSFLELPTAEAFLIWDRSIEVARTIGELAAWVVAGHFSALLCTVGQHANEPMVRDWLRRVAIERSDWFARWHARDEALHTAELAGEALKWLQLFDILSLWPCSQYPVPGEQTPRYPQPFSFEENWTLVHEIRPADEQPSSGPCRIVFDPWPFGDAGFSLSASASLVPVRRYADSRELLAACVPFTTEWVLTSRTA
jgi:hypothetical protein